MTQPGNTPSQPSTTRRPGVRRLGLLTLGVAGLLNSANLSGFDSTSHHRAPALERAVLASNEGVLPALQFGLSLGGAVYLARWSP